MLQLFSPKSTPRMRTSFMPPSYRHPVMVEERGGPFHKGGGSLRVVHAGREVAVHAREGGRRGQVVARGGLYARVLGTAIRER